MTDGRCPVFALLQRQAGGCGARWGMVEMGEAVRYVTTVASRRLWCSQGPILAKIGQEGCGFRCVAPSWCYAVVLP